MILVVVFLAAIAVLTVCGYYARPAMKELKQQNRGAAL